MRCPPCNNDCNQGRDCPARICAGKHKYASKSLVDMIVGYKQGAKLESYKCPHCDFYHVREAKEPVRELKKAPK